MRHSNQQRRQARCEVLSNLGFAQIVDQLFEVSHGSNRSAYSAHKLDDLGLLCVKSGEFGETWTLPVPIFHFFFSQPASSIDSTDQAPVSEKRGPLILL